MPANTILRLMLNKDVQRMKEDKRYLMLARDKLLNELLELIEKRFYTAAASAFGRGFSDV